METPTTFDVNEETSGSYLATLQNDLGAFLPASALLTLTLTLYVIQADGSTAIVNGRNAQDVLNLNDVSVFDALQTLADGSGRTYSLRWNFQPADTTLVDATLPVERHIALFEWTWDAGGGDAGAGKQEAVLAVRNLVLV